VTAPDAVVVPPEARRHLAAAGRFLAAAVIGGIVGGIVFLIMVQGAFRRGYTDLDFNHVLGTLVEGTASETTSTDEALGIIGDTVGKSGLYATCIAAVALMILHGLVITRLVRRHWLVQALPLAVVTFLVVGLLYCGLADSRLDTPTGLFGADAGGMTPLVLGLSSLGFAVVASRCYSLIEDAGWWVPKHESIETALEAVPDVDDSPAPSLELAEEGPEQRRVRP
jgi:hypothetical protein